MVTKEKEDGSVCGLFLAWLWGSVAWWYRDKEHEKTEEKQGDAVYLLSKLISAGKSVI